MINEPEIIDASRAWVESQRLLATGVDGSRPVYRNVAVGWYDTQLDEHEGAFCVVDPAGALAGLVGDTLRIGYRGSYAYVYCLRRTALPVEICLARRAFMALERLAEDEIVCKIEVLL